jgi:hypothetical protein
MTEYATCGVENCNPVLQARGSMGHGDYMDVYLPNGQPDLNFYKKVDLEDCNPNDVRILCKTCGLATGWFTKDFPNLPGAGMDYLISKVWVELVGAKKTKAEMLAEMVQKFGQDAVNKHFKHSLSEWLES